jgi:hypothetical protein
MEAVPAIRRRNTAGLRSCAILWLGLASVPCLHATDTAVPIKTIYVIPGSHWDLGFLRPPLQEMDAIKPHLDAVIDACSADPQFRWTIESVWQLQAGMERTKDPAQIERLAALMRKGQIELSASDGSMHTEFMGAEELNRIASGRIEFEHRFGIQANVAMMNDVPGFSLRLPQVLARSGVKYLITGSNTALGGGMQLAPGAMPIYWESPDGSRILMWQTQGKNGGYTEGLTDFFLAPSAEDPYLHTRFYPKEWTGLSNIEIMQRGIDKLLKQYTEAGYRHSMLAVLFMHDGIGPEYELKDLLPSVRAWNDAGKSPRIVVATPSEFFRDLTAHDANNIPVYQGDWAGLWSQVKLNSSAISADARAAQDQLPQAETLWSLLLLHGRALRYPAAELQSDYRHLFVYDEHNGAGQAGWPKVMTHAEVLQQNQQYADALRAVHTSTAGLLTGGVKLLAATGNSDSHERMLLVYNPLSWTSSQLVRVPALQGDWVVRDAASRLLVPSQHLLSGDLTFDAQQVPPIGYRTYILEKAARPADASAIVNSSILESPFFEVDIDAETGTVRRITDRRRHRVLVNSEAGDYAGQMMRGSAPYPSSAKSERLILHHEKGALLDQIVIERPGSAWSRAIIALPQSEPAIRFNEEIDRTKLPLIKNGDHSEPFAFAFKFSFTGKVQRAVENGEGLYRFPQSLLPGARSDAAVPRHTLVWTEDTPTGSYHVSLAQKQAFFDKFDTGAGQPGSRSSQGVEAEVMIKSDQGETRDEGIVSFDTFEPGYPGTYQYDFAVTSEVGPADPVDAHRFGMQDAFVLAELPPHNRPAEWTRSFLSLSAPNVVVLALKPANDHHPDDFMLRLQEIAGQSTRLHLDFGSPIDSIAETDLTEDRILRSAVNKDDLYLSPYETLTLRLTVPHSVLDSSKDKH